MADILSKFTNYDLYSAVEKGEITIQEGEAKALQRQYTDDAALKILAQDYETAEADKAWQDLSNMWTVCDQLLQTPWESQYFYNPAKANVPRYTLSNIIDIVTTRAHSALFFDETPFMLLPNPKVDQKTIWAKEAVLSTQLRGMDWDVECDKGWHQCALYGTQIYKYGWIDDTKEEVVIKRKGDPITVSTDLGDRVIDTPESDDFELVSEKKDIHRMWCKWRDLRYLMFAPTWNEGDARKAPWVIDHEYGTLDEIEDTLRDQKGYDLPPVDELKDLFFPPLVQEPQAGDVSETRPIQMRSSLSHGMGREVNDSADPYLRKIEIIERWDKKRVTVALRYSNKFCLIRNEMHGNTDDNGSPAVPYLSSTWRPLISCGFGQGLGQLVGPDQQIEKGTLGAYLDILAFLARPSYIRKKGLNSQNQNITVDLGTIISVETDGDVRQAFGMLEQPRVDQPLVAAIEAAKSSAANTAGVNELYGAGGTVGGGRATGTRSGSGAQNVAQAQASRLDGPMERFIRQIFVPLLYIMDRENSRRLPTRCLREILADDAKDYSGLDHMKFRTAKVDFQVLAGAHLGSRKEMAQWMPFVLQLNSAPAFTQSMENANLVFDGPVFVKYWAQLAGVKYNMPFWRAMTDEEKQRRDANSPAAVAQVKGKQANDLLDKKTDAKNQEIQTTAIARTAGDISRLTAEKLIEQGISPIDEEDQE